VDDNSRQYKSVNNKKRSEANCEDDKLRRNVCYLYWRETELSATHVC
jgi:hypothetical protein